MVPTVCNTAKTRTRLHQAAPCIWQTKQKWPTFSKLVLSFLQAGVMNSRIPLGWPFCFAKMLAGPRVVTTHNVASSGDVGIQRTRMDTSVVVSWKPIPCTLCGSRSSLFSCLGCFPAPTQSDCSNRSAIIALTASGRQCLSSSLFLSSYARHLVVPTSVHAQQLNVVYLRPLRGCLHDPTNYLLVTLLRT